MHTYYDVLELEPTATEEEIRRAYLRKVIKVHPDRSTEPEANAQFQLVQEAYECLSDCRARARYDQKMEAEEDTLSDGLTEDVLANALERSEALMLRFSAYLYYLEALRLQRIVQLQRMSRPVPVIRPMGPPIISRIPNHYMVAMIRRGPIVAGMGWQGLHWMA